jgi:hypothetical protein
MATAVSGATPDTAALCRAYEGAAPGDESLAQQKAPVTFSAGAFVFYLR